MNSITDTTKVQVVILVYKEIIYNILRSLAL